MRNITTKLLFLALTALLLFACGQPSNVKKALRLAGENRAQLEQVLDHYAQDPADSLKLKAAQFLIGNMPGHYALGGKYLDEYVRKLDSAHPNMPYDVRKVLYILPSRMPAFVDRLEAREDVKYITADYLIKSIDDSFRIWESSPWLEFLSFEDFCDYLLPYRMANEPLDNWKDSITMFSDLIQEGISNYSDAERTPLGLKNFLFIRMLERRADSLYFGVNIPDPAIGRYWIDCVDRSLSDGFICRISGIPMSIDFIPHWAAQDGRHYSLAIIDGRYKDATLQEPIPLHIPKIFRKTFSINPTIPQPRRNKDYIPPQFRDPFNKDVTDLYVAVADVDVRLDIESGHKPKLAYLGVSNDRSWQPVYWGEVKGKKTRFEKMGLGLMYLPMYYNGAEKCYAGLPFFLDKNGKIKEMKPDTTTIQTVRINRKFPFAAGDKERIRWGISFLDSRFEASNDPQFRISDTLHVITENYFGDSVRVVLPSKGTKYRYWRFVNPGKLVNDLAELTFRDRSGNRMTGKLSSDPLFPAADTTLQKAFDQDRLTYMTVNRWLQVDFGQPVEVNQIVYLPRNDANGIYPGHTYELLYFDKGGWKSLGSKQAVGFDIAFDQVPGNALLWLRNLTEGREERIFTYERGHVRFW